VSAFEPGIFFDMPEEEYHAPQLGVLSCSAIKQLLRSPAHYAAWLREEQDRKATAAQIFGRALHCAVLEPERFARSYAVLPADAPRRPSITQRNAANPSADTVLAIQWWDRWNRAGKITLEQENNDRIVAMAASIAAHPWARLMLHKGHSEVVIRWIDEASGLPCKLRADYVREIDSPGRLCIDVKAVKDASPRGFRRALAEYHYPLQRAHYSEGFKAIGKPLAGFIFLAVENEAPYTAQPYVLGAESEMAGELERARGAEILRRCMASGSFPGYSDDLLSIDLPPWALKEINEEVPTE
jgi:exodeoxyribonuclease VIII